MNSTYITEGAYENAAQMWKGFESLQSYIGEPHEIDCESFRISFQGESKSHQAKQWRRKLNVLNQGVLLEGQLSDASFSNILHRLKNQQNQFSLCFSERRNAQLFQIKPDAEGQAVLILPVDDRPENVLKFLSPYLKALVKIVSFPVSTIQFEMERFLDFCVDQNQGEFVLSPGWFKKRFFKMNGHWSFTPTWNTLGRHQILHTIEIRHHDFGTLVQLLAELQAVRDSKSSTSKARFQFFDPSMEVEAFEPYVREQTIELEPFSDLSPIRELMDKASSNLTDVFALFEQRIQGHEELQSTLYTLRKTNHDDYEIRFNPYWRGKKNSEWILQLQNDLDLELHEF